jgi:DNA helicase II / ATP-dependent DNA helicase PcrA
MDILSDLNPEQRVAVEHGQGPALVLAGAGSGKTRVITYRVAYLIQNSAVRPENILAVTFTNKAAKEMRDRIHDLLGPRRASEPLISTFHSLCVRLLRREIQNLGMKRDFSIYDTDDQKRLLKQILQEMKIPESTFPPREALSRISYAKNHNVSPEGYSARFHSNTAEDLAAVYSRYNERLRQSNALDFDDLLLMTVALLERFPNLSAYYSDWYRYILVDEYQDANKPQYELLRLLTSKHKNLFVVGDEDQSIYKFRGADIQNILRFEKDFPGARIIRLEQNYRSTQNILKVAGAVVGNNIERKGKTLWTENASGDVITCHCSRSAREESVWVTRQIRDILADNPEYRVAVLYRANFISRNFEDVLTAESIPYAVVGSVAFFGRMEVKDMLAYLKAVFNPEDDVALLRIINTPPRGIGGTTIEMLTQSALQRGMPISQVLSEKARDPQLPIRAARSLLHFQEMLESWMALRDTSSPARLLESIFREIGYKEMLERQETTQEAANRIANIEELIRAAEEAEKRGETVFEFLDRASLSSELDHLDPKARVALMTLHSAKGLEFDAVFLVGLEEGLFPHSLSSKSESDIEEERRLCYVGLTRARRKLFLTWTPFRRAFGSEAGGPARPSRFFKEMPPELLEGLDLSPSFDFGPRESFRRKEESSYGMKRERRWEEDSVEETDGDYPKSIAELRTYLEKQNAKPSVKDTSTSGVLLKSGMRVRHDKFGEGIIISRERVGNDTKITITFSRVGRKTLMESYAKLQAI